MNSSVRCEPTKTPDDIDVSARREKYRQEAEKRRRPDHNKQFIATTGAFADFYETDPYAPLGPRDPISEDTDALVLGGGFAGLMAAARLKQAGIAKMRIVEMG